MVFGGMGEDALEGGDGSDVLYGGGGNDTLNMTGTRLVDQQFGGGGNDYLTGSDGNEIFEGGAGVDSIYGGNGLEVIRILDHPDIDFVDGGGALATGSTRWNRVSSRRGGGGRSGGADLVAGRRAEPDGAEHRMGQRYAKGRCLYGDRQSGGTVGSQRQ